MKALLLSSVVYIAGMLVNAYAFGHAPVTSYSNNQGSPTVTTNITPASGAVANIVDGNTTTGVFKFASALNDKLKWIKFTFATPKCIDAFKWYADLTNNHGTWWLGASSNGVDFVELSSFTLSGATTGTEFTFTNTNGYTIYILQCQMGQQVSTVPENREVLWRIDDASAATVPTTTASYLHKYGSRDRTSFLTVTSTSGNGGGTPSNLVDGEAVDNSTDSWWFQGGQSSREILFDAGVGNTVRWHEFKWYQDNTTSHGTWKASWSSDNSSFTDFNVDGASTFTLGGASIKTYDFSAMGIAKRYVRLQQQTGSTSSSPFLREAQIKASSA